MDCITEKCMLCKSFWIRASSICLNEAIRFISASPAVPIAPRASSISLRCMIVHRSFQYSSTEVQKRSELLGSIQTSIYLPESAVSVQRCWLLWALPFLNLPESRPSYCDNFQNDYDFIGTPKEANMRTAHCFLL